MPSIAETYQGLVSDPNYANDPEAQQLAAKLKAKAAPVYQGLIADPGFKQDLEAQQMAHKLRASGLVTDPTQGGSVPTNTGATGGGALPVIPGSQYASMSPNERHLTDLLSSVGPTENDLAIQPFLQGSYDNEQAAAAKQAQMSKPTSLWGIPGTPIYNDAKRLGGVVNRPVVNGITVATFGNGGPKRYYGAHGEPLPSGDPRVAAAIGAVHPNMQASDIPQAFKEVAPTAVNRGIAGMAEDVGTLASAGMHASGLGLVAPGLIPKLSKGVGNIAAGVGGLPFQAAQAATNFVLQDVDPGAASANQEFQQSNINAIGAGPGGPLAKLKSGDIKGGVSQLVQSAEEHPVEWAAAVIPGLIRGGIRGTVSLRDGLLSRADELGEQADTALDDVTAKKYQDKAAGVRAKADQITAIIDRTKGKFTPGPTGPAPVLNSNALVTATRRPNLNATITAKRISGEWSTDDSYYGTPARVVGNGQDFTVFRDDKPRGTFPTLGEAFSKSGVGAQDWKVTPSKTSQPATSVGVQGNATEPVNPDAPSVQTGTGPRANAFANQSPEDQELSRQQAETLRPFAKDAADHAIVTNMGTGVGLDEGAAKLGISIDDYRDRYIRMGNEKDDALDKRLGNDLKDATSQELFTLESHRSLKTQAVTAAYHEGKASVDDVVAAERAERAVQEERIARTHDMRSDPIGNASPDSFKEGDPVELHYGEDAFKKMAGDSGGSVPLGTKAKIIRVNAAADPAKTGYIVEIADGTRLGARHSDLRPMSSHATDNGVSPSYTRTVHSDGTSTISGVATKADFSQALQDQFGYGKSHADDTAALADARAGAFERQGMGTREDWYRSRVEQVNQGINPFTGNKAHFSVDEESPSAGIRIGAGKNGGHVWYGLKAATLESGAHELGHAFLEDLRQAAVNGHSQSAGDLALVNKWFEGRKGRPTDPEDRYTFDHEGFADALPQFLREGVAPTPELQGVFQRFSAWLTNLYRGIKDTPLGEQLSPAMREVMGRLLGKEDGERVVDSKEPPPLAEVKASPIKAAVDLPPKPDMIASINPNYTGLDTEGNASVKASAARTGTVKPFVSWDDRRKQGRELNMQVEELKKLPLSQLPLDAEGKHVDPNTFVSNLRELMAHFGREDAKAFEAYQEAVKESDPTVGEKLKASQDASANLDAVTPHLSHWVGEKGRGLNEQKDIPGGYAPTETARVRQELAQLPRPTDVKTDPESSSVPSTAKPRKGQNRAAKGEYNPKRAKTVTEDEAQAIRDARAARKAKPLLHTPKKQESETGEALSNAVRADGHAMIVTKDNHGASEIVDLSRTSGRSQPLFHTPKTIKLSQEDTEDLVKLGAHHIESGAKNIETFAKKMREEEPRLSDGQVAALKNKAEVELLGNIRKRQRKVSGDVLVDFANRLGSKGRLSKFLDALDAGDGTHTIIDKILHGETDTLTPDQKALLEKAYRDNVKKPGPKKPVPPGALADVDRLLTEQKAARQTMPTNTDRLHGYFTGRLGKAGADALKAKMGDVYGRVADGTATPDELTETARQYELIRKGRTVTSGTPGYKPIGLPEAIQAHRNAVAEVAKAQKAATPKTVADTFKARVQQGLGKDGADAFYKDVAADPNAATSLAKLHSGAAMTPADYKPLLDAYAKNKPAPKAGTPTPHAEFNQALADAKKDANFAERQKPENQLNRLLSGRVGRDNVDTFKASLASRPHGQSALNKLTQGDTNLTNDERTVVAEALQDAKLPKREGTGSELAGALSKIVADVRAGRTNYEDPIQLSRRELSTIAPDRKDEITKHLATIETGPDGKPTAQGYKDLFAFRRDVTRQAAKDAFKALSWSEKAGVTYANVSGARRAIMTGFDISAAGRQGYVLVVANPRLALWGKDSPFVRQLAAFRSEKAAMDVMHDINSRPNALDGTYKKAKLALTNTEAGGSLEKLSEHEENYMSNLVNRIPGLAGSERAYTTFLNKLRADNFDFLAETVRRRDGKLSDADAKQIANFVNDATGRADFGKMNSAAPLLNGIIFSPRFVASRVKLLTAAPLWSGSGGLTSRALIARTYVQSVAGMAAVLGLLKLSGATVSFDNRSSDFLKAKYKNHVIVDSMAGLSQIMVFAGREARQEKVTQSGKVQHLGKGYGVDNGLDVFGSFLRSKLSPDAGLAADLLARKDFLGNPITPLGTKKDLFLDGEIARQTLPLSMPDIVDATRKQGLPAGVSVLAGNTLGVGVNYQPPKNKWEH